MKINAIKSLVKEANTFLVQAKIEKDPFLKDMYTKASLAFSWFGLEGFANNSLSDFIYLKNLQLHERSLIEEKKIEFLKGEFLLKGKKYYPTRDKISFLLKRFGNYDFEKSTLWVKMRNFEDWRDSLVHPKPFGNISLTIKQATSALELTKIIIELVYKKVYKKTVKI